MLDQLVIVIFVLLAGAFLFLIFRMEDTLTDSTILACVFCMIFVDYCFLFSNGGFVSVFSEALNQWPYVFLSYAGIRTTMNELKARKSPLEQSLNFFYVVITGVFLIAYLYMIDFGMNLRNNWLIMFPGNVLVVVYLGIMYVLNIIYWLREGIFEPALLILNYAFNAFTISFYELYDWGTFVSGNYMTYGMIYVDPTHFFDVFWILFNVFFVLFLPRVVFKIRKRQK